MFLYMVWSLRFKAFFPHRESQHINVWRLGDSLNVSLLFRNIFINLFFFYFFQPGFISDVARARKILRSNATLLLWRSSCSFRLRSTVIFFRLSTDICDCKRFFWTTLLLFMILNTPVMSIDTFLVWLWDTLSRIWSTFFLHLNSIPPLSCARRQYWYFRLTWLKCERRYSDIWNH